MSEYPHPSDLKRIENWKGTPRQLVEFIGDLWNYRSATDWVIRKGVDSLGRMTFKTSASTRGWSGNEDILATLEHTWFNFMFAESWSRGGHYEYEISPTLIDTKSENGWGKIKPNPPKRAGRGK